MALYKEYFSEEKINQRRIFGKSNKDLEAIADISKYLKAFEERIQERLMEYLNAIPYIEDFKKESPEKNITYEFEGDYYTLKFLEEEKTEVRGIFKKKFVEKYQKLLVEMSSEKFEEDITLCLLNTNKEDNIKTLSSFDLNNEVEYKKVLLIIKSLKKVEYILANALMNYAKEINAEKEKEYQFISNSVDNLIDFVQQ